VAIEPSGTSSGVVPIFLLFGLVEEMTGITVLVFELFEHHLDGEPI